MNLKINLHSCRVFSVSCRFKATAAGSPSPRKLNAFSSVSGVEAMDDTPEVEAGETEGLPPFCTGIAMGLEGGKRGVGGKVGRVRRVSTRGKAAACWIRGSEGY